MIGDCGEKAGERYFQHPFCSGQPKGASFFLGCSMFLVQMLHPIFVWFFRKHNSVFSLAFFFCECKDVSEYASLWTCMSNYTTM